MYVCVYLGSRPLKPPAEHLVGDCYLQMTCCFTTSVNMMLIGNELIRAKTILEKHTNCKNIEFKLIKAEKLKTHRFHGVVATENIVAIFNGEQLLPPRISRALRNKTQRLLVHSVKSAQFIRVALRHLLATRSLVHVIKKS